METKLNDLSVNLRYEEIKQMLLDFNYSEEAINIIEKENLLNLNLLKRLHYLYPQHSRFFRKEKAFFKDKNYYVGLNGFREIVATLKENGIELDHIKEREFFIEVYRFMSTRHVLNSIDWHNYKNDSMFYLVIPQPDMIKKEETEKYLNAKTDEEREKIVKEYQKKTNPHDGKQKLNKPWFYDENGEMIILEGVQHKYPPILLVFDKTTQNCFSFCTYCFRHAQVRNDEDMFIQENIEIVHKYLRKHKEVSDILITGGDGGFITYERLEQYVKPILEDPELFHIKTIRIGSRALTFYPELILSEKFTKYLELFKKVYDHGVQLVWNSHFSTPKELLHPATIAAARRLKNYQVTLKSQSPIMRSISLFLDKDGNVDVDKSAQNWIDLGNILAMLGIGFHSMYCARPTGEHHYFTAPLKDINKIFSKVYKELVSMNRPSRYITMTSSAGKISLLGEAEIDGEKVFVLKFNEGRNMDWIDKVYFAKWDEKENTIANLKPFKGEKHFYEDELEEIENRLEEAFLKAKNKKK